jgi:hypothetical protein
MPRIRILVLALSLLALGAVSSALAGTYPQNHNGWNVGVGFGGGSAGLSDDSGNNSDRTGGGMGNFRVGYPLNEKVSLQLEGNAWSKSENGVTVTFGATTAGVAFFPSEGWVLRGGLGFGTTTVSVDFGNATITSTERGVGLHGAAAYEFRLARTFAIGPQVDLGYASFDGGSSNWIGAGLQLNWYFIPKS